MDEDALRRVYQDDPDDPTRGELVAIILPLALAAWAVVGLLVWLLWRSL